MEEQVYMLELSIDNDELNIPTFRRFTYQAPRFGDLYDRFRKVFVGLRFSKEERVFISHTLQSYDKKEADGIIHDFLSKQHNMYSPRTTRIVTEFFYELVDFLEKKNLYNIQTLDMVLKNVDVDYTEILIEDFI